MSIENWPLWLLIFNFLAPVLLWLKNDLFVKIWVASVSLIQLIGVCLLLFFQTDFSHLLEYSLWIPPWSKVFLILIWGIGALILHYAYNYFSKSPSEQRRALALLTLFLASMQGMVMSESLLLLFIFWEMTTLSSFLMIGHNFSNADARAGALRALYITGAGGLCLLFGILLISQDAGTLSLQKLLSQNYILTSSALALISIGALTKSAQFPFHFWLPDAMNAPTPISAYLHSATMVKAGLFLVGLIIPIAGNALDWGLTLTFLGGITAVLGGVVALFQRDLKKLLAYTTVSALGMIMLTLSQSSVITFQAATFFIIVHAIYKGGLFMVIGWVDHLYHTRDSKKLGGLYHHHPAMAVTTLLLCLTMAGFIPTIGHFSKEFLYQSLVDSSFIGTIFLFVASILNAVAAYHFFASIFLGPSQNQKSTHRGNELAFAPGALAAFSFILIFIRPNFVDLFLRPLGESDPPQLDWLPHTQSVAWLTLATFIFAALIIKFGRAYFYNPRHLIRLPNLSKVFDRGILLSLKGLNSISHQVFKGAHQRHLILGLVGVLAIFAFAFYKATPSALIMPSLRRIPEIWEISLFTLIALPAASIPFIQGRVSALLVGSASGLGICLLFALYSAPDLALTQLIVETLVLVMFVYSVNKLPKVFLSRSFAPHYLQITLAAIFSTFLTILVSSAYYLQGPKQISEFFGENSLLKGFGKNVVNVILVDFRALDTMGEITVLALASVGVFALLRPAKRESTVIDPPQNIWAVTIALKLLIPVMLGLSAYLFLRGHNAPGGGFIAGLVAGLSLILQERTPRLGRPFRLLFIGLGVSLLSGLLSLFQGLPFFTAIWGPELPGGIKLGTVLTFDLGVFILVVGMVQLIARLLSRREEETSS